AVDLRALDHDVADLAGVHVGEELGKRDVVRARPLTRVLEQREESEQEQDDNHPEGEIAQIGVHSTSLIGAPASRPARSGPATRGTRPCFSRPQCRFETRLCQANGPNLINTIPAVPPLPSAQLAAVTAGHTGTWDRDELRPRRAGAFSTTRRSAARLPTAPAKV